MYNVLSLALGLLSWAVGGAAAWKPGGVKRVFFSLLCCAGALLSQLMDIDRLAAIGDWAAIQDTMGAVVFAAAVLTAVTAVLNTIAVLRGKP